MKTVIIKVNHYDELELIPIIGELIKLGYKIRLAEENINIIKNYPFSEDVIEIIKFNKITIADENFFNDTFLIINTIEEYNSEFSHKKYRKNVLKNNIIQCSTLHHAKGFIRTLQFYQLKDLEPIPISSKGLIAYSSENVKTNQSLGRINPMIYPFNHK